MAELPPSADPLPDPAAADAGGPPSIRFAERLSAFTRRDPQTASAFFQTFLGLIVTARGRRQVSDEVIRAAFDLRDKQEQRDERRFRFLVTWFGVLAMTVLITVVALAVVLREHVELVRAVFEGLGLLVTHGAVGTGGYLIGRSNRRSRTGR